MHPHIDQVDEHTALTLLDRPLVRLSHGLADGFARAAETGSIPTVVTPDTTRLTYPLRALVASGTVRWAARNPAGRYFDGLTGLVLHTHQGHFAPAPDGSVDEGWVAGACGPTSSQVLCAVTVKHSASARVRVAAAGALCRLSTGRSPRGWGCTEPVSERFDADALTAFCRNRAPSPTRAIVVGDGFVATVEVSRTEAGVQEDVIALITADRRDDKVERVCSALAAMTDEMTVAFAIAHTRSGQADLTTPARRERPPIPFALVLGPRACRQIGLDVLHAAPIPDPTTLGRARLPGLLYRIDGGFTEAWSAVNTFVDYLGPERIKAAAPLSGGAAQPTQETIWPAMSMPN